MVEKGTPPHSRRCINIYRGIVPLDCDSVKYRVGILLIAKKPHVVLLAKGMWACSGYEI